MADPYQPILSDSCLLQRGDCCGLLSGEATHPTNRRLPMKSSIRMTSWLRLLLIGVLVVFVPSTAGADAPALSKTTYTYKSVRKTKIKADVYRAANTADPAGVHQPDARAVS